MLPNWKNRTKFLMKDWWTFQFLWKNSSFTLKTLCINQTLHLMAFDANLYFLFILLFEIEKKWMKINSNKWLIVVIWQNLKFIVLEISWVLFFSLSNFIHRAIQSIISNSKIISIYALSFGFSKKCLF